MCIILHCGEIIKNVSQPTSPSTAHSSIQPTERFKSLWISRLVLKQKESPLKLVSTLVCLLLSLTLTPLPCTTFTCSLTIFFWAKKTHVKTNFFDRYPAKLPSAGKRREWKMYSTCRFNNRASSSSSSNSTHKHACMQAKNRLILKYLTVNGKKIARSFSIRKNIPCRLYITMMISTIIAKKKTIRFFFVFFLCEESPPAFTRLYIKWWLVSCLMPLSLLWIHKVQRFIHSAFLLLPLFYGASKCLSTSALLYFLSLSL